VLPCPWGGLHASATHLCRSGTAIDVGQEDRSNGPEEARRGGSGEIIENQGCLMNLPPPPMPSRMLLSHGLRLSPRCRGATRLTALAVGENIMGAGRGEELDGTPALLAGPGARAFAAAEGDMVIDSGSRQVHHDHAGCRVSA